MTRLFVVFLSLFLSLFTYAEHLPVEAFGNLPKIKQVKLSPDGKKFAFFNSIAGSTFLGINDLETGKLNYVLQTDNQKFKMEWYVWANNNMLLVSADFPNAKFGVKFTESRLLKVKTDGSNGLESVFYPKRKDRIPQFQNNIIDLLPDEPDHILMGLDLKRANAPGVYKVDLTARSKRSRVYSAKSDIYDWMTDRQHRLRLGFGRDDTKIFYRFYDLTTKEWRNIWEYEIFDAPDITPLGFGLDPNKLYIRANHNGRYAIFKVDLTTPDLKKTLVFSDENYDVEGSLIYSTKTNDVVGVYHGEADDAKVFFAKEHEAFQRSLNKAIPNAYNNIASMSKDERKYVLYSSDDKSPGAFYLGNRDAGTLEFVLDQYPLLREQPLSGKHKISYKARDGVAIEAYVTLPHENVKNLGAAVVIPHGGPMSRNYAGFDWFSEFFASRGYTVIEPNFRGSSGYGFAFEMQSIQQWGGAMQDDLADAAKWIVEDQNIDAKRVCIVGGSYGGYAALMAAAKQQDTFRCSASFAGVTDLSLLVRKARRFTNYKVVKKQIGTKSLDERSPINFSEQVSIPVLLIHGDKDRIVDVSHSRFMYEELQDEKKDVEYIELENGNHHLEIEKNRLKTLSALEQFLHRNLAANAS